MSERLECADCGRTNAKHPHGWHSVITQDLESRVYCDPCYRYRSARGWVFDGQTTGQLAQRVVSDFLELTGAIPVQRGE